MTTPPTPVLLPPILPISICRLASSYLFRFTGSPRLSYFDLQARLVLPISIYSLASAEAPPRLALPPHQTQIVHREPPADAEDRDDDGQADGDFGGGHGHDEEDQHLAVVAAEP